ncbi:MAG: hypothetical protein INR71_05035 [Terriglobus roseus]|nr:hypothetical protein [Terriglobus roseus]
MYYNAGCWNNDSEYILTTPELGLVTSDSSPDSVLTTSTGRTSPPKSPIRSYGAQLLPKVRAQDQVTDPVAGVGPIRHQKRTVSNMSHFQSSVFPYTVARPTLNCRGISPSKDSDIVSPASVNTTLTSPIAFTAPQLQQSRRSSLAPTVRASSVGPSLEHSRSGSLSSLDDVTLGRFGYPTYRQAPAYITSASSFPSATVTHAPPVSMFGPMPQVHDAFGLSQGPVAQVATSAFNGAVATSSGSSSVLTYLTSANPTPTLVRRLQSVQRNVTPHFWFDIRNLRQWKDFSMDSIAGISDLLRLIQVPVDNTFLPAPERTTSHPETEADLHDIHSEHYCTKVNAALQVTQGSHHMVMRAVKPQAGARLSPDFVSSYPTDAEKTFQGELRGRVVGLVKAYDEWNTGMRSQGPIQKVDYLKGLAHLHRVMREHGCRYGFIVTEIELLCVRAGGLGSGEALSNPGFDETTPIFGYLEIATPIQLSSSSDKGASSTPLTAGLALWYLHMLAKDEPLPGAGSWRMEVGGPIARTRANCIPKDDWIPKPIVSEKREAKRFRGWTMPDEPFNRKELGGKKKGGK